MESIRHNKPALENSPWKLTDWTRRPLVGEATKRPKVTLKRAGKLYS